MIATFWDKLFEYADKVKKEHGKASAEYKTVHEIKGILQAVYDGNNQFENAVIDAKPKTKAEAYIFEHLPEVKVFKDNDGYYYEIDKHHKDTPSEVINYVLMGRDQAYRSIGNVYKKACEKAVNDFTTALKTTLLKEFREALDEMPEDTNERVVKWQISEIQAKKRELNKQEKELNDLQNKLNARELALKEKEEKLGEEE